MQPDGWKVIGGPADGMTISNVDAERCLRVIDMAGQSHHYELDGDRLVYAGPELPEVDFDYVEFERRFRNYVERGVPA
jgi:hypothetical protein